MNYLKRLLSGEKVNKDTILEERDAHLEYPDKAMYELLEEAVLKYPNYNVLEYYGKNVTYKNFYKKIIDCAKSLKTIGVMENDKVTICMPNTPEAIIMFYAINMVGAVASMIHPLSSVNEIEYYIDVAESKYVLTLNLFAEKVVEASRRSNCKKVIVCEVTDGMFYALKKAVNIYTKVSNYINKKKINVPKGDDVIRWHDFILLGNDYTNEYKVKARGDKEAVILYSGGTTGKPKGVRLSNMNFNALGMQCFKMTGASAGESVLTILPIFHGFGIGVSVHTLLISGMKSVLIPQFNAKDFVKLIKRHKPVFLAGVPTMYEALTKNQEDSNYLKCVKNCICGGDLLQPALRQKVNDYLKAHGSDAQIRVGYGLSESTAACILTPSGYYKEGGLGLPLCDVAVKIMKPETNRELKPNQIGEICVSGPTVMLGYLNEEEETKKALIKDANGKVWLHTGDLGYKDKEGFIFFKSRLKRMIVTSGYNIYPSYMEKIIMAHPAVEGCVVVGVPHPYKQQAPVACIVLKNNYTQTDELTSNIKAYCSQSISKYSMPYRYHYIKSIPKTLLGKINYKKLEEECTKKYGRTK